MHDRVDVSRLHKLPPLELLVAFDAAARHLSFTRAGEEIALTQSAVSRQIQALEERLGVALFRRLHRALALTDEGRSLHAATAEALDRLDRATRELTQSGRLKTVVVTTTPGFAGLWLIPRLASFVSMHPEVDVRISAVNALADLERGGVDVAVRYQSVSAAGETGVRLFGETVFPVCSPRLRGPSHPPLLRPADLAAHALLRMEPDDRNPLHDWDLWLQAMGLAGLQPARLLHFSSYDQLILAALAGQGIALGRLPLIESHLRSRKLVAPFSESVVSPRGYYMLVARAAAARPEVRAFTEWLVTSAEATAPGRGRGSARPRGRAPA